ncbi:hypothetical protein K441DRAFT_681069 [Lecanosticta acicola]|uniref:Uncharacterized protein n=1 Tax=Lecanosticta acicola TaxID=111012 RepID=A0AAI9EAE1_9PEZI|nr:hypothetical protein K441DRAFT_681069 [Lecanosticta acicola]
MDCPQVGGRAVPPIPADALYGLVDDECGNKNCVECISQFFGLTRLQYAIQYIRKELGIPDKLAQAKARTYAQQIERDREYLRNGLHRHGDLVLSKWKKKTKVKREALLLAAQPDLYRHACIQQRTMFRMDGKLTDFDRVAPGEKAISMGDPTCRRAMLLPYLNVDSLARDPMRLISLFHYRSSYKPEEWVSFDFAQMRVAFEGAQVSIRYNDNSLILHGPRFGDLVPYEQEEAHTRKTIGYARGECILEAQAFLLGFLRRIFDVLVPSKTVERGNVCWSTLTSIGFKSPGDVEFWPPYANAPFSRPPVFDLQKHTQMLKAALAAAEDHLRFLQTDPAYVQDLIAKERSRLAFTKFGSEHVALHLHDWIVSRPRINAARLRGVVRELEYVSKVCPESEGQMRIGAKLSKGYEQALSGLEYLCTFSHRHERQDLRDRLRILPQFRDNYQTTHKGKEGIFTMLKCLGGYRDVREGLFRFDRLHYWLVQLTKDPESATADHPPILMGHLEEHLARSDGRERARIPPDVYEQLSRMCCYFELVWAIRLLRPLPAVFDLRALPAAECERELGPWKQMKRRGTRTESDAVADWNEFRRLLEASVDAPWPKGKHDADWLARATESRTRLNAMWAHVRKGRKAAVIALGSTDAEIDDEVLPLSAALTEGHKAEVQAEKDEVARFLEAETAKKAVLAGDTPIPLQTVWGDAEHNQRDEVMPSIGRTKLNSRPDASQATLSTDVRLETDEGSPTIAKIEVNSESLLVFRRMFPCPSGGETKGIIKWQQLVSAMADAGFSAAHCGGSAVHFTNTEGSVVFHKPHPDLEVDLITLRIMGKRMRRWFGWERDSFVDRQE